MSPKLRPVEMMDEYSCGEGQLMNGCPDGVGPLTFVEDHRKNVQANFTKAFHAIGFQ